MSQIGGQAALNASREQQDQDDNQNDTDDPNSPIAHAITIAAETDR
jgi:hypothetical protein